MDEALLAAERMTEALLQMLRLARAMAGAGRAVALDGLADQIGFLCAKAMDLPPEQGRQLRLRLLGLLAEVDAVSTALHAQPAPFTRQKADSCPYLPPPS